MGPITSFRGEYNFLSNFYPSLVRLDGVEYPTVENAYQAAKTQDPEQRRQFVYILPGQAKRLGKRLAFIRPDWDDMKVRIMRELLDQKFAFGTPLAEKLLQTYPCELVEENTWGDMFWGVCLGAGENRLGHMLMSIRAMLAHRRTTIEPPFPVPTVIWLQGSYGTYENAALMRFIVGIDGELELNTVQVLNHDFTEKGAQHDD